MLSIRSIVKDYENHRALNSVSMEIPKGSVFGLLGPNGAGKTSLIRIINQITKADSGEIYFKDEKLQEKHISSIGYLPEERGLYKKMGVADQIVYLAQLKGLSKQEAEKRAKQWFERLEMKSWWNKNVEDLSKGMQQKVQFVATVIHQPELLILDEPFSGFDPINAEMIKNEFLNLNQQGTTIIFSSHRMESVEELCSHIAILNLSEKMLEGKVSDIRKQYSKNCFEITYNNAESIDLNGSSAFQSIGNAKIKEGKFVQEIQLNAGFQINDAITFLMPKIQFNGIKEIIPSINEIFIYQVKNA